MGQGSLDGAADRVLDGVLVVGHLRVELVDHDRRFSVDLGVLALETDVDHCRQRVRVCGVRACEVMAFRPCRHTGHAQTWSSPLPPFENPRIEMKAALNPNRPSWRGRSSNS